MGDKVQRYDLFTNALEGNRIDIGEMSGGRFVLNSDYEALEAKLLAMEYAKREADDAEAICEGNKKFLAALEREQ